MQHEEKYTYEKHQAPNDKFQIMLIRDNIKKIIMKRSGVLTRRANHKQGFTLVETFVAITILMFAIVGPLSLAERSISSANLTKEKLVAYYLAQDAIEYIRIMRDENVLSTNPTNNWESFLADISQCGGDIDDGPKCTIDTSKDYKVNNNNNNGIDDCSWSTCKRMDYDINTGVYRYNTSNATQGWEKTPFKRGIRVTTLETTAGDEHMLAIEVTVEWKSAGYGDQTIELRDTLLNW